MAVVHFRAEIVAAESICDETADHHPASDQEDEYGSCDAGLVRGQIVVAIEEARQPRQKYSGGEHLETTTDVGEQHGWIGEQRGHRRTKTVVSHRFPGGIRRGLDGVSGELLLGDEGTEERDQNQTEDCHGGKRPPPTELDCDEPTDCHTDDRTERSTGHEGTCKSCVHAGRKHTEDHGDTHAAVRRFTDTDQEPGAQHLFVGLSDCAQQRRDTPQHRHQDQALDAAPAVREQRQRERQQPDHQCHHAAQGGEVRIGEIPVRFQNREDCTEHLPRHVVREQKTESQGENDPRV